MTKKEMQLFIQQLEAEKAEMVAKIETLQAKPEKAAKTRKPRRTKIVDTPKAAAPLPGTTAYALAERQKAARPTFTGNASLDDFASKFDFFVREYVTLDSKGKPRATGYKAWQARKATATCDAMKAAFELVKAGQKVNLDEIALKSGHHRDSVKGHARKLLPFTEWLAQGQPKVEKNSIEPAVW